MVVFKSSTQILITWNDPPEDDFNGIIRSYDIQLEEQETQTVTVLTSVTTQITLSSLHPYYNYNISVAAVTVSRGPFSSPVSVITDEAGTLY